MRNLLAQPSDRFFGGDEWLIAKLICSDVVLLEAPHEVIAKRLSPFTRTCRLQRQTEHFPVQRFSTIEAVN